MIERYYFCTTARDGVVLNTALRRGRFINITHFVELLTHWAGNCADVDYFYYPAKRPAYGATPELIDHTNTMVHLAR